MNAVSKAWLAAAIAVGASGGVQAEGIMVVPMSSVSSTVKAAGNFQRDLSPDRPDTTESPYTVECGRWQLESNLWTMTRDKVTGESTETWTFAETNLKLGITDNQDLQLVLRPYTRETVRGGGSKSTAEGFGDIDVRYKFNLWGNDGGKTAGGLMPFVTVPTNTAVSEEEWSGGLIFPVAVELSERVGLGLMAEVDRVWNSDDGNHDWDFVHTAVLGFDLGHDVGLYLEYIGVTGDHGYESSASGGVTWGMTENLQWDTGLVVGLSDAAEDLTLFQGVTFRW